MLSVPFYTDTFLYEAVNEDLTMVVYQPYENAMSPFAADYQHPPANEYSTVFEREGHCIFSINVSEIIPVLAPATIPCYEVFPYVSTTIEVEPILAPMFAFNDTHPALCEYEFNSNYEVTNGGYVETTNNFIGNTEVMLTTSFAEESNMSSGVEMEPNIVSMFPCNEIDLAVCKYEFNTNYGVKNCEYIESPNNFIVNTEMVLTNSFAEEVSISSDVGVEPIIVQMFPCNDVDPAVCKYELSSNYEVKSSDYIETPDNFIGNTEMVVTNSFAEESRMSSAVEMEPIIAPMFPCNELDPTVYEYKFNTNYNVRNCGYFETPNYFIGNTAMMLTNSFPEEENISSAVGVESIIAPNPCNSTEPAVYEINTNYEMKKSDNIITPNNSTGNTETTNSFAEEVSMTPVGCLVETQHTAEVTETTKQKLDPPTPGTIEFYLSLHKDLFPAPNSFEIDPNPIIDQFCNIVNIKAHTSWLLDLEFGLPKVPVSRAGAIYDVKSNSIHCNDAPATVHPGFEKCESEFKREILSYYDHIVSTWYEGYICFNKDITPENFQKWLLAPLQHLGMAWR